MDAANRPIYSALGAVIRRRRRTLELTQEELARSIGISRGALANIETGRQNVLLHQLYRFATVLDMDVHDLLPPPPSTAPPAPPPKELPLPKGLTAEQKSQVAGVFATGVQRKSSTKEK
jgi:transcriptional regulator with XRE-family HTH domain